MKILLAGGGTGGHIMPILAVYRQIKRLRNDVDFLWIGEKEGLEAKFAAEEKIEFKPVLAGKMRRYFSLKNIIDLFKTPIGVVQSYLAVKKFKPDILFSKGGYVSVPTVLACNRLKVPIILHESDVVPGKANLFLAKFADKIACGFLESKKYFKGYENKIILTGNPVREEILAGNKEQGGRDFNLKFGKPVLLIMGGSQGAVRINEMILEILPELLKKWQVVHLLGRRDYQGLLGTIKDNKGLEGIMMDDYHAFGFLNGKKMGNALASADLIISRSGANSLAEMAAIKKPAILIPYPFAASDHQRLNAEIFAKAGAAKILDERSLNGELLLNEISILDLVKLAKMSVEAGKLADLDATEKIANIILSFKK